MKLWVAGFRMKWNLIAYLQDWVKLEGSKLVWLDTTDNLFTECQFPVLNAPPGRLVALYGQKGLEAQWREECVLNLLRAQNWPAAVAAWKQISTNGAPPLSLRKSFVMSIAVAAADDVYEGLV